MPPELLRQSVELDEASAPAVAAALVHAPSGIAITSLAGSLLYANGAFLNCFELGKLDGVRLRDITRLTRGALSEAFLRDAARADRKREMRIVWPGSAGPRELVCAAMRVAHQSIPAYIALSIQDVSELVADHRRQLRTARELLDAQQLIGAASWVMTVHPSELRASSITWTEGAPALFCDGCPPATLGAFIECVEPVYRERMLEAIEHAVARQGEYVVEYAFLPERGISSPMRSAGRVAADSVAPLSRLCAIEIDLSFRSRDDATLPLCAALLEHLDVPIVWLDRRSRYRYFNRAFATLFSASKTPVPRLGEPILQSIDDPQRRRLVAEMFARVMKGETPVYEREFVDDTGQVAQCIDFHYTPLRLASGAIDGALVVGRDVTALNRANLRHRHLNDELARLLERRGAKIGAVVHDLANRIATTCGDVKDELQQLRAELCKEGALPDAASGAMLERIARIDARLERLAQLASVNAARKESRSIDMNRLVRQVRNELTATLTGPAIEFDIDRLPHASGDVGLIRQIFVNLLANAIRATRDVPVPRVRVWAAERNDRLVWSVADNGIGFDMKDADAMFSSFAGRGTRAPGIGLGIVWHAVQQLGGRIWCESQPGQGGTFHFTLERRDGSP
jgi:PAS domain S-box-containing protein